MYDQLRFYNRRCRHSCYGCHCSCKYWWWQQYWRRQSFRPQRAENACASDNDYWEMEED